MSHKSGITVARGFLIEVDGVNKGPWIRLVNRLCDLHEAVAVVRIAKTVPEHDGERSRGLGFPGRKGVLRRERKGRGHGSQEEREGRGVHVCLVRWILAIPWCQFQRPRSAARPIERGEELA